MRIQIERREGSTLFLLVITCISSLLLLPAAQAQSSEGSNAVVRATTNAFVALASEDSLSGGSYKFKNDGPDAEMDLYKLIAEIPLTEEADQFVPLLELAPGYLKFEQRARNGDLVSTADVDSWSMGVGLGVEVKLLENILSLTPRIKVEYADIDYKVFIPGIDEETLRDRYPNISAWSYIPSLEARVAQPLSEASNLHLSSRISYVYVDAAADGATNADFSDESWIWKNQVAYEHRLSESEKLGPLFIRPSIGRVDAHGAARNGFEFDNFYEFGVELVSRKLPGEILKEVAIGTTYIYEAEVQGWRFGVSGKLL